ncbi:hypothetical protein CspHIS471_0304080 [Cutaneotrichosporon sp. HIS471]|nr:hypothetical protein CspHIS471_0304080 [Cutaneotrichosporon sp. HIS471]
MADPDIARRIPSPTSTLPLPRALRHSKSFTQLARFIGFSTIDHDADAGADDQLQTDSGSEVGDEHEDENASPVDDDPEVDEESLMWDAQTALIAHQPALAAKYYATAALPPYSSPAACLALGNLLARGSGLTQPEDSPQSTVAKPKTDSGSPSRSWLSSFFRVPHALAPVSNPAPVESPKEEFPGLRTTRLSSNGWELPKDGKRVVRNVEAMGKAAGWLVLGVGQILETEADRAVKPVERPRKASVEDGAVVFDSKGKGRAHSHHNLTQVISHPATGGVNNNAPYGESDLTIAVKLIRLLYDLLTPLVQMYRHGHIQRHDPVALPPISHSQLPRALNPKGDKERGRNAWHLGSAVASKLLDLPLLTSTVSLGREANARRQGVLIMANYIRGLTSSLEVAEVCCKNVIRLGPCGLDLPDDLIRQAFRRLKSILKTTGGSPLSSSDADSFPFPPTPGEPRRRESNASWVSAADSNMTAPLRLMSPVKSNASLASLAFDNPIVESTPTGPRQGAATTLRGIQQSQRRVQSSREAASTLKQPWWPTLEGWSMATPRETVQRGPRDETQRRPRPREFESVSKAEIKKPQLRIIASSPQLRSGIPMSPPTRRRLPFEPKEAVASIDPELAALELASALTKHVQCGVCGADGVNFPNCRKCGLTFCSRPCRISETGAGNGKRHVCGAWESRRLLAPPGQASYAPQPRVSVPTS